MVYHKHVLPYGKKMNAILYHSTVLKYANRHSACNREWAFT